LKRSANWRKCQKAAILASKEFEPEVIHQQLENALVSAVLQKNA
jgi:hypothetical protein